MLVRPASHPWFYRAALTVLTCASWLSVGPVHAQLQITELMSDPINEDAWEWIEAHGGPTRANGDHVRATFLGQGHTKDYEVMYRDYAGRDPSVQPMLRAKGLAGAE